MDHHKHETAFLKSPPALFPSRLPKRAFKSAENLLRSNTIYTFREVLVSHVGYWNSRRKLFAYAIGLTSGCGCSFIQTAHKEKIHDVNSKGEFCGGGNKNPYGTKWWERNLPQLRRWQCWALNRVPRNEWRSLCYPSAETSCISQKLDQQNTCNYFFDYILIPIRKGEKKKKKFS